MTFTVTLDKASEDGLERMAVMAQSDGQKVLENIIMETVREKLRRFAAVEEAREDIRAGRVMPHDEAMRHVAETIKQVAARKNG